MNELYSSHHRHYLSSWLAKLRLMRYKQDNQPPVPLSQRCRDFTKIIMALFQILYTFALNEIITKLMIAVQTDLCLPLVPYVNFCLRFIEKSVYNKI